MFLLWDFLLSQDWGREGGGEGQPRGVSSRVLRGKFDVALDLRQQEIPVQKRSQVYDIASILESFRFEDGNESEFEI